MNETRCSALVEMSIVEAILEVKRAPTHGVRPEDLNPNKFRQRAAAAGYLAKHGTIMELYAGDGDLSEKVYSKLNPRRMVLVDDDEQALQKAKSRLADVGVAKYFYPMKNEKFIKEKARLFKDTTLVDFDAYGSPSRTVQLFFDNFRVREPMIVCFTDGLPVHMQRTVGYIERRYVGPFGKELIFKMVPPLPAFGHYDSSAGTGGGKVRQAGFLRSLIPKDIGTYIEPFAGSAALFFALDPPPGQAVLNDITPDFPKIWHFIQTATPEEIAELQHRKWSANRNDFFQVRDHFKPKSRVDEVWKALYVARHSFRKNRRSWRGEYANPPNQDPAWLNRLAKYRNQLENVKIENQDWKEIVRKYDSPNVFFYFDPPYEEKYAKELLEILPNLKGRWLLSFSGDSDLKQALDNMGAGTHLVTVTNALHGGASPVRKKQRRELLAANYPINVPDDLTFKGYSPEETDTPTLGEICGYHEMMMKNIGSRRRFKSWRINRAFGGQSDRVIYAAYLLRPLAKS